MANKNDVSKTIIVQGRIVFVIGDDLFSGGQAKAYGTNNPKLNSKGQQFREYGFGLAVPKANLNQNPDEIWASIHEVAQRLYGTSPIPQGFHYKWVDGDTGTLKDGTPVNTKEGYPGHIVFTCKTTFPITFFKYDETQKQNVQVNEGIYCGDYVNVQLNIGGHVGVNAGLYLNPNMVQFVGHGKRIVNQPSANAVFGQGAPVLPPGASATPVAHPSATFPMQPQQPVNPQGAPQMPPQFGAVPPQMPQQPATPNYAVLPPQFQQPQMPQQPVVPQQHQIAAHQQWLNQQPQNGTPQMPGIPGMPQAPR